MLYISVFIFLYIHMTKPREDLHWEKLISEREKRRYIKSNGNEYELIVSKEALDYTDHVDQDLWIFIWERKSFTYEEFDAWDMRTM